MDYEEFVVLYHHALESNTIEEYIEKCTDNSKDDLKIIYSLAHSTQRSSREKIKLGRAKFSRTYNIPIKTIENWDFNRAAQASYVKMLIDYTFFIKLTK